VLLYLIKINKEKYNYKKMAVFLIVTVGVAIFIVQEVVILIVFIILHLHAKINTLMI
jgi:type IV secretory pathway VirB3-like protein